MGDVLRSIIPQFYGVTMLNNVEFIRMEHLTQNCPDSGTSIMDIKLGSKTYLRSEENTKQRRDLYQKVSQDLLQEKTTSNDILRTTWLLFTSNLTNF